LREIIGNPFRPVTVELAWPSAVVELAQALYSGADCAFALHDTLLEMGQEMLAIHFQQTNHPRGCWAMDLILGLDGSREVKETCKESQES